MIILGRRQSPATVATASALLALCVLVLGSTIAAAAGAATFLAAPGRFLLGGFSWAAFFAPLYLCAGAALLLAPVFRRRSALLLMFSIIPFLTLSLILHILRAPGSTLPQLLVDSFGVVPSALLLFLLLALEVIFLLTLPGGRVSVRRSTPARPARKPLALPVIAPAQPVVAAHRPAPIVPVEAPEQPHEEKPPEAEKEQPRVPERKRPPEPAHVPGPEREQAELPFPAEGASSRAAYGIPVHRVLKSRAFSLE